MSSDTEVRLVGVQRSWRGRSWSAEVAAISLTDTEASLTGNQGLLDRVLCWRRFRGAGLVLALLAAFVFGLCGAPSARAQGGLLTSLSPAFVEAGERPARIVVSPDGTSAYATDKYTTTVSQYSRNTETGKLTPLSPATVEAGFSPEGVAVSPDGENVYVADRYSNTVSQFERYGEPQRRSGGRLSLRLRHHDLLRIQCAVHDASWIGNRLRVGVRAGGWPGRGQQLLLPDCREEPGGYELRRRSAAHHAAPHDAGAAARPRRPGNVG
jgi:Lactonase, 7-bladed beta-propeller